jgi:hypothetical protein
MASPNTFAGDDSFDVLTTHVVALQTLLDSGRLTSVHLVEKYLAQIERHNVTGMAIRALISIAPRVSLLKQASDLDVERKIRGKRGPMHGIPVIVKVSRIFEAIREWASLTSIRTHSGHIRPYRWIRLVEPLHYEVQAHQETLLLLISQVDCLHHLHLKLTSTSFCKPA